MKLLKTFFCSTLIVFSGLASAKSQLQEDKERFKSLFVSLADSGGADLVMCGMRDTRDSLIKSATFLVAGYHRLNKGFDLADPSIETQVRNRNDYMLELLTRGNTDNTKHCEFVRNIEAPDLEKRYEKAEKNLRERLIKAGIDPENLSTQSNKTEGGNGGCSNRAQYYQDSYQRSGRVEDLVCLRKALARELR